MSNRTVLAVIWLVFAVVSGRLLIFYAETLAHKEFWASEFLLVGTSIFLTRLLREKTTP